MKLEKICVGGWFQRTHLHLREIYHFLKEGDSPLDLDKRKLKSFQKNLKLKTAEMKVEDLEYVELNNDYNVKVKIYEDGLIVLSKKPESTIKNEIQKLTSYYETRLSPGLSYIFSLGAPIPKELAGIKTIYPYFVVINNANKIDINKLLKDFQQKKYFEIKEKTFEIYRGNKLYIINNIEEKISNIEKFIQEQIFIREFRGQMHRYLNLHRIIWERIAEVKESGKIKGKNVGPFKDKIESYSKTINLIEARINQMGVYVHTREVIVKNDKELSRFMNILKLKYETLSNTLEYIKEIWKMTKNYVNSAINLFSAIRAESTQSSVQNLAVITAMGVGATLIGLFTKKAPEFTWFGATYFFALAFIGYATNKLIKIIYQNRMYKIKETKIVKDIK